jgi:arginyl-tRNA synthetase
VVGSENNQSAYKIPFVSNNAFGSVSDALTKLFATAFSELGIADELGKVVISERRDLSDYQCNGALAAAKELKQNPRQIAEKIIDIVRKSQEQEIFSVLSIDGPGFINIKLSDKFLISTLRSLQQNKIIAPLPTNELKDTIVDFGGPNVAKPLHVGHLRSALIGDCLQKLCKFLGIKTLSDIHLGDWGTPMGMLITEVQRKSPDLPYFRDNYSGPFPQESPVTIDDLEELYPKAAIRCRENEKDMQEALSLTAQLQNGKPSVKALWHHFINVSIQALKDDYGQLNIHFDLWKGESDVHDRIPKILNVLKDKGYAVTSDGALIIPLSSENDSVEIPPFILTKSDGSYLYSTTDLATLEERIDDLHAKQIFYVVDKRQSLHFKQLFLAGRKVGLVPENVHLEHIAFGTVNGPDRKPFKTRAGGVMKLKDLINMSIEEARKRLSEMRAAAEYDPAEREEIAKAVGMAALKYGDLMHDHNTDYVFDLEKFSRFEGRTGPYILYAAVRIKAILRKAKEQNLAIGPITITSGTEQALMLELLRLPDILYTTYYKRMPNYLCDYAYELAYNFNRFYLESHILSEKDESLRSSWLGLCDLCLFELETILSLLGIDVPKRM